MLLALFQLLLMKRIIILPVNIYIYIDNNNNNYCELIIYTIIFFSSSCRGVIGHSYT